MVSVCSLFNNKYYEIPADSTQYREVIARAAEGHLKEQGFMVNTLKVDNELRKEYNPFISRKLSGHLSRLAVSKNIDTIFLLHDGQCGVYEQNRFGATIGLPVSGHGLARRVSISVKQYACLTIDIVKVDGFKVMVNRRNTSFKYFPSGKILTKIFSKKDDFEFTEYENKTLTENINKMFARSTTVLLQESMKEPVPGNDDF